MTALMMKPSTRMGLGTNSNNTNAILLLCSTIQNQFQFCRHLLCTPHHHYPPPRRLHLQGLSRPPSFLATDPKLHLSKPLYSNLLFVPRAADSTQPSVSAAADKPIVSDDEFSLAKVSFGVIGLGLGITLLSYGFGAYFSILPGSEWSALMLTYGFPLALIGMAFKYAELKPVPCLTYADAQILRETCATPTLKQVRSDVTRYRYGDEQHLDEALKRIFQYGLGGGIPRRSAPILQMIREEVGLALLMHVREG